MPTAHLLLQIDTTTTPPTVTHASVYSERQPSTIGFSPVYVELDKATGTTFGEARERVLTMNKHHTWLQPLLRR